MKRPVCAVASGALLCWTAAVQAQTVNATPKEDHSIVYELGWAGSYSHAEGFDAKGATAAFEVTPVPDRLELEAGATFIRASGSTETSVDLLFKKPWTFSPTVEFMAGVGPEVIHATGAGTFLGLSAVGDFMFWPTKNVGWYLEPAYEVALRNGTHAGDFAMAGGLIIGR